MTVHVTPDKLELARFVRPGDRIVLGQACGEPTTLVEALIEQAAEIGGLSVFIATSFSGLLTPEAADAFEVSSMGAIGALRVLAQAHRLTVVPCHVSQVGPMIASGALPCDVAFVQVSPPDAAGDHSCGLISDYVAAAVAKARVVVAEVNDQVPRTLGETLPGSAFDCAVHVSRPPVEVPPARIGPIDEAIAAHAAAYIGDGSVLQTGVGAVPDALLRLLHDRTDLGVHSGMIGDGLVDLVEAGVVTNARKKTDQGVSVNGALIGTSRLYAFAADNPSLRMCPTSYTHDPAVLARVDRLVTVNSALEVDLTGQVNAEQSGSSYVGGTGGQLDFVRAGSRSPGGHALMVLPSTAKNGTISRITTALSGPVTTPRSDIDVVITEFGSADLKGRSIAARARLLVEIAHPDFREALEREADALRRRGF
ncbi:acetyl-CoA hydrolase/transferase C-terminal domain-containing protein [Actinocorallia aurea]